MYYDPEVRKDCLRELYNIINKFGVISLTPDLEKLYEKYYCDKKSVVFAIGFNLQRNSILCSQLVDYFTKFLTNLDIKIAAISKNNKTKIMDLHERDFPGMDLENLILQSKAGEDNEHLVDMLHRGIEMFTGISDGVLVVFYKKENEGNSIGTLATLQDVVPKGLKIVLVNIGESFGLDLEIFIENNDGDLMVTKESDFSESLIKIKNILIESRRD